MDRKIIHYHDVTSLQRRAQHLFNIEAKGFGIDRSFQHPGRAHTVETERGQQRDIRAIVLRYGFYHSLAWRRTPVAARQSQIDSRLVNELQTFQHPLTRLFLILSAHLHHPRRVTFGGIRRLFLRGRFKRFSSRHIVIGTTLEPLFAAICSQSSASVRSGCAATAARIFDSSFFKLRWRPPARGKASQSPVLRHLRQSFSTNERLTPNVAATSDWESVALSKAAMILSRRSWEYGFITGAYSFLTRTLNCYSL